MSSPPDAELARKAQQLLAAHHRERPLLLPNAWDVASARAVEKAGFPVVATTSHAIAEVLGEPDDDSSDPDAIFSFISRIVRAVSVPVTADLQGGFQLPPAELVDRLLGAGAVGCNLEDIGHHGGGVLLDADWQAAFLAGVRAASDRRGVHVVVNARVDTFIRGLGDRPAQVDETIRRGGLYLQAGADCIYPIGASHPEDMAALVSGVPGPLNLLARRGGPSIADLTALGARRISLASGIFNLVNARHSEIVAALAGGADLGDL